MKAILLRTRAQNCYIIGTNDELTKVLDACSHHKRLSQLPYFFWNCEKVCPNYEISEEEKDKLHVVYLEREFDCTEFDCAECAWDTNLLYSVMTPSDFLSLPDDVKTPYDLYYYMRDTYFGDMVICVYDFDVDTIYNVLTNIGKI